MVPPNVLLVVLDTARADALEPYGAPAGSSPVVAGLGRSGRALEQVYATACWTLPSHASMFMGLLPRSVGVGGPGVPREETARILRARGDRALPEVMRRAGYATGAVSANPWISRTAGFDTGFERFAFAKPTRKAKIDGSRIRWAAESLSAHADEGAADAERVMASWIDGLDREHPFFWFVNLLECHSPYLPPRPYNDLRSLDRLRAGFEARRHLTMVGIWRACVGELDIPAEALERMRHLYRRSIRYMDDWLGRLLERLDAAGVLADTIVIVTADHGENLGENGLIGHCFSLDDRLIRVPFLAAGPGTDRLPAGVTSLAELPRLVAELAGVQGAPWGPLGLPPGVAVAQVDPPVRADHPKAASVREEWNLDDEGFIRLTTPFECATDGRFKLLRRGGAELLYDVREDPLESNPIELNGSPPPSEARNAVALLREALLEPAAIAARPPPHRPVEAPEPSDEEAKELEERMRLLGYL